MSAEIASQPACWRQAAGLLPQLGDLLPRHGERVAVVGCGTSWFMAMSYAALREQSGAGETDAFAASEMPLGREYDRVVALTRSGTTSEVLSLLRQLPSRSVAITASAGMPVEGVADDTIVLDFADERSVVQTRFATTMLALLRGHLGHDLDLLAAQAEEALQSPVEQHLHTDQATFLGRGWTIGLAHEAALKCREVAQFWAESYPAMDYRHGPISIAQPGRLVWCFGTAPHGLPDEVRATGAALETSRLDPLAQLVAAQRYALGLGERRGLDPDHPRNLSRSVVLGGATAR